MSAGRFRRGGAGSWTNIAEAEVAVRQIAAMVRHAGRSVGVVTPFAAQAALIQRLARRDEQLGDERLEAADFCCGTAHRFQGGERDTIVFSAVLTPGIPQRTAAWVEREKNLINVAVSHARQSLVVLGHPEIDAQLSPTLASLRSYLRHISTDDDDDVMRPAIDEIRTDSQAEARLLDAMRDAGFQPRGKLYVQGYELGLRAAGTRTAAECRSRRRSPRGRQGQTAPPGPRPRPDTGRDWLGGDSDSRLALQLGHRGSNSRHSSAPAEPLECVTVP